MLFHITCGSATRSIEVPPDATVAQVAEEAAAAFGQETGAAGMELRWGDHGQTYDPDLPLCDTGLDAGDAGELVPSRRVARTAALGGTGGSRFDGEASRGAGRVVELTVWRGNYYGGDEVKRVRLTYADGTEVEHGGQVDRTDTARSTRFAEGEYITAIGGETSPRGFVHSLAISTNLAPVHVPRGLAMPGADVQLLYAFGGAGDVVDGIGFAVEYTPAGPTDAAGEEEDGCSGDSLN